MVFHKKILQMLLLPVISVAAVLLFLSCDDSASGEEDIEQIVASEKGDSDIKNSLWNKWAENLILPETWVRSPRPYSEDNEDGYTDTDAIFMTYQQNWQGKPIYLARNFRDEDGKILIEGDIIFFFDNKYSNDDGYYIYYNTLPLKDEPPEEDDE